MHLPCLFYSPGCEGRFPVVAAPSLQAAPFVASRNAVGGDGPCRRSSNGRLLVHGSTIRSGRHPPSALQVLFGPFCAEHAALCPRDDSLWSMFDHKCGQVDHSRGNLSGLPIQLVPASRIGREALALLMATPGQELHTREIARRVNADAHPVQRALEQMLDAGLVQSRRLGNLRLWSTRDTELAAPVREILRRTAGVAEALRGALSSMRGVQLAFLFGSYASGEDKLGSDIDLFIVGAPDWTELSHVVTKHEGGLAREINSVVWTIDELQSPTPKQQRFLNSLMRKPKIWLVGDDDELERLRSALGAKVVRKSTRPTRPRRSGRAASPARAR